MRSIRPGLAVPVIASMLLGTLVACSSDNSKLSAYPDTAMHGALESFTSCDEVVAELKHNAVEHVGPWGFNDSGLRAFDEETVMAVDGADQQRSPQKAATQEHSKTNIQELGVDEPDLVKTDGKKLVTVTGAVVSVVDIATHTVVGTVDLTTETDAVNVQKASMLLENNRLLVMWQSRMSIPFDGSDRVRPGESPTYVVLIDLAAEPTVIDTFQFEGVYIDARSVKGVARLVMRSSPNIPFTYESQRDVAEMTKANQKTVMASEDDAWFPTYRLNGEAQQVHCTSIARPATYSGTSMLTVLTFDMNARLTDGMPVTIVADGDTVYGTGDALYVANDESNIFIAETADTSKAATKVETQLYRFSLEGAKPPKFASSGSVPGYLLNSYSMSEWDGYLRVATTKDPRFDTGAESSSAVSILELEGDEMTEVGRVDELGKGERIYAVRYLGDVGYVVTFRQTDPLYALDLADPAQPTMTGELKINGYSSYLHPIGDDLLLGVGQDATDEGILTGSQVSLFDVSDPASPRRVSQVTLDGGQSSVEWDPHAFLYWEPTGLVAIPINAEQTFTQVLSIDGSELTETAQIIQEGNGNLVDRVIVIGNELWTTSHGLIQVTSMDDWEQITSISL